MTTNRHVHQCEVCGIRFLCDQEPVALCSTSRCGLTDCDEPVRSKAWGERTVVACGGTTVWAEENP